MKHLKSLEQYNYAKTHTWKQPSKLIVYLIWCIENNKEAIIQETKYQYNTRVRNEQRKQRKKNGYQEIEFI